MLLSTISWNVLLNTRQMRIDHRARIFLKGSQHLSLSKYFVNILATWKIIQAFLDADQKRKVVMLKKKDLKNYIPEAGTWWEHMQEKEKDKN